MQEEVDRSEPRTDRDEKSDGDRRLPGSPEPLVYGAEEVSPSPIPPIPIPGRLIADVKPAVILRVEGGKFRYVATIPP